MRVYEIYDFVYTKTKNKSLVYLKLPNTYKAKLKKESKSFKKQNMKEVKPFIPKKSKALPKKNSLNTSSCSFLPKTKKAKLSPDAPFFTPSSSQIPQLMEDHFESSGDFDEEQDTKEEGDSIEETNSKEEGGSIEDSSENIIEDEPHSKACTDVEEALKKLSIECENKSKEKVFEDSSRPKTSHAEEEAKHLQSSITKLSLCSKIYKSQKKLDECKKLESTPSLNLKSKNFTPSQTAGKKLSL
mmetsp:Transcript_14402/g.14365  ORF Transcript_14402/g.14365 Transcript_14402/m.14365 type:complete len:243 (-) Transcript_14402:44-772(-)|eukprot:CAMPEP_0197018884 /NCGR_PEP_ID=MMETSP1380-20130617/80364_1 /TAXON_ID=5936 /ORGANISM="Euplotes crassus, Strain CT5" /LENGTH=242 /DNA_ID=CAMNT_0042446181 /DNA_START=852 /DNA_END=1580 /DNA_ORIENTATION=-